MTGLKAPLAGVGIPALIGTLLLAAILAGFIGSAVFSGVIIGLEGFGTDEPLADAVQTSLISGLFIGLFAAPIILLALTFAGIPMAVAFARRNLSYRLRYLWSGIASVTLGALLGAGMWAGDPYGWLIGGSFALLSAWVWLTLLRRFDRSRLPVAAPPVSAPAASA